jgi:AcrB/AcrD/AcrF family
MMVPPTARSVGLHSPRHTSRRLNWSDPDFWNLNVSNWNTIAQRMLAREGDRTMWIVKVALSRPYTFIVLALLILILSPVIILRTPTDIFPNINIPVIAVAWQFTGLNPEEMEGRFTTAYERILTTTVENIEHIESTTVSG